MPRSRLLPRARWRLQLGAFSSRQPVTGNRQPLLDYQVISAPGERPMSSIKEAHRAATGRDFLHRTTAEVDPEIADAIALETTRQNDTLELIASENHVSHAVLSAMGSVFTNKYAE